MFCLVSCKQHVLLDESQTETNPKYVIGLLRDKFSFTKVEMTISSEM